MSYVVRGSRIYSISFKTNLISGFFNRWYIYHYDHCILTGYPGDKTEKTHPMIHQWKENFPIKREFSMDRFVHTGATFGGNSGSPIYRMKDKRRACVVGIHVGGDEDKDENYAVRINRHMSIGI